MRKAHLEETIRRFCFSTRHETSLEEHVLRRVDNAKLFRGAPSRTKSLSIVNIIISATGSGRADQTFELRVTLGLLFQIITFAMTASREGSQRSLDNIITFSNRDQLRITAVVSGIPLSCIGIVKP